MFVRNDIEYRYYLTDLLSNQIISEVPFRGVSYERVNRRAGSFSGTIPFIEVTSGLNLYEATMPGRSGIYIMRDSTCVWGGIIWARTYDVSNRELSVSGSEFMSYFYKRNIWRTIQYGSDFIGVFSYEVSNGVATITTEGPHGFSTGDMIRVTFVSPAVDGTYAISSVPAADQFSYETDFSDTSGFSTSGACRTLIDTYDLARDLIFQGSTDLGTFNFLNEAIKPAKEFETSVIAKERSGNFVTLSTDTPHDIIIGQQIEVVEVGSGFDGFHTVVEIPDNQTLRFPLIGGDVPRQSIFGIRQLNVVSKALNDGVSTVVLDKPHNASVGQTVFLDGVDAFFTGIIDRTFNGRFTISAVPNEFSFSFVSGAILNLAPQPVAGGIATFGPKVIYGDFGSYTSNADIGIEFENFEKSGFYQDTQVFRGFEQKTIGEILENYSNTEEGGFEYRIDCIYDFDSASFRRVFKLIPVEPESPPSSEDGIYTPQELGADQIIFEFPGNISTFSVEESAENASTRFFVVGQIADLGDEASQPYAGASAKDLLDNKNGRSWPLIDQTDRADEIEDELALYDYARDFLLESRPPIGVYTVTVNGSISPTIGSYEPGQWCSLIIDDEFVRQRFESGVEPRKDVLVRKIESFSVNVTDSTVIPEVVELRLIADWKVDNNGV
jgi:hypothetical protein